MIADIRWGSGKELPLYVVPILNCRSRDESLRRIKQTREEFNDVNAQQFLRNPAVPKALEQSDIQVKDARI